MNFLIKIVGEKKSSDHRKQDGYSGIRYLFRWNPEVRGYTYEPKNQAEVDDLFRKKTALAQYSPVEKAPAKAPVSNERLVRLDAAIERYGKGLTGVANVDGTITVTLPEATPDQLAELTKPAAITLLPASRSPLNPNLVEQCLARGVIVTEDDTDEIASRLTTAYDKGATDQLSRVAGANARPRKTSAPAAAKTG